ncbi:MAG: DHH family phosphoesterase [bacterium]|nr:DHH family phosphoesterase [bacterium]
MAEIKNLKKGAARILKAIEKGERIVLYGDADLDGVSAVIILEQAIRSKGGRVASYYFPDREKEGYGITKDALKKLKKLAPALLVALDLGISNFEEIKEAKKLGFEVMVVDHHVPLGGKLPAADLIIDPKQKGDRYPFKEFAACGLSFKVAEAMFASSLPNALRSSLLELAALGTIADMMKREEDNEKIIAEGLLTLENSWNPGIQAFLQTDPFASIENITAKVYRMISVLNVRDVKNGFPGAFRLLTVPTLEEAKVLLADFVEQTVVRKARIRQLADEVKERVRLSQPSPVIFQGGNSFEFMHLGAVASIVENEFGKPTFIFKKGEKESLGSVRAPAGRDTVKAMESCADLLGAFGGHPQASGFRIKTQNLEKFRRCLEDHFSKQNG